MFNIANIFTAANLMSGILAILLAVGGRLDLAPFAIFLGALFDFLDGFVARLLKTSSELGKQLDSLADMVTFGVAPGIIIMVLMVEVSTDSFKSFTPLVLDTMNGGHLTFNQWLGAVFSGDIGFSINNYFPFIALLIPFFSLFRLAKFNLDVRQTTSFIGLPTPANTLFFMSFPLAYFYSYPITSLGLEMYSFLYHPAFLGVLIILLSVMLVSEIHLFSLKFKSMKWKGNEMRYIFLFISLIFIIIFRMWSFALIVFLYLILAFAENTFIKKKIDEI